MLMQGCWLEGRRKPLAIHLPKGALRPLREMLRAVFIFDEVLPFRLQLTSLVAAKPANICGVRVTAFHTSHLDGYKALLGKKYGSRFDAYSFLLEADGRRVAHSADLGKPEDLEPLLQKPVDLLVCELAHFSSESLFSYLRGRKIKNLVFIHLSRQVRQNLAQTRRLAARMLGGIPHAFARDGQVIGF